MWKNPFQLHFTIILTFHNYNLFLYLQKRCSMEGLIPFWIYVLCDLLYQIDEAGFSASPAYLPGHNSFKVIEWNSIRLKVIS